MTKNIIWWLLIAVVSATVLLYAQKVESEAQAATEALQQAIEDVVSEPPRVVLIATTTTPKKPTDVKGLIEWYADINGAPQDQAYWIAQCESQLINQCNKTSCVYGMGIYQFVQSTFNALCEGEVMNIDDNINCGTRLIGEGKLGHWQPYSGSCWLPHISL